MRRSIVYAAISIAGSCSAFCGGGGGVGAEGVEDLPKSDAKEEERREELFWVMVARCPGRGGSGGLDTRCGGRGRVLVYAGRVKMG
jgi:hypothetical protein